MRLSRWCTHQVRTHSNALEQYKTEAAIYFHWPYCLQLCSYCNFNKYTRPERRQGKDFEQQMKSSFLRETQTLMELSHVKTIKSVYFGGGTPSLAQPKTIKAVLNLIKCWMAPSAEVTLECNPSSSNKWEQLEEYRSLGITRISVGIQSTRDNILKFLGRDHTYQDSLVLLQKAQQIFGPNAITVDLLFAKPHDTVQSWKEELFEVLGKKPAHVSLYELTPERGTLMFKQIEAGKLKLPGSDLKAAMYEEAVTLLSNANYLRYEVSNFALEGCESQHNQNYWNGVQYIGVGPGAHGRFFLRDSKWREARIQILDPLLWQQTVAKYGHATQVRQSQSQLDILQEIVATSLRTVKGICQSRWNIFEPVRTLHQVLNPSAARFIDSGLLQWDKEGNLSATKTGLPVIDSILPSLLIRLAGFYRDEDSTTVDRR